jgi:monoamine oxidase
MAKDVDCIVIGAGVAGLVTARELRSRGRTVTVLEARERVGGRTLSTALGGARLDLGGQWIGPRQHHVIALLEELGLRTFPQHHEGRTVLIRGGRRRTYAGTVPPLPLLGLADLFFAGRAIDRAATSLENAPPGRLGEWDTQSLEAWLQRHTRTDSARFVLRNVARAILAVEPSELSFLYFVDYIRRGGTLEEVAGIAGGAQETRVVLGMQSLAERLAASLGDHVVLDAPVLTVEQTSEFLIVRTVRGAHTARRAVVTVPPALAGRIHFTSTLPARRDSAMQRLPMGATIKYLATYDRPFWRAAGLSGEASTDSGSILMTMDACSADGSVAALVAFSVGAAARRMAELSAAERRVAVLVELERLFGQQAGHPTRFIEHSWVDDPWSRGCYVGVPGPGVWSSLGAVLREPCGHVHWAGGETALQWPGIDGAIESGRRAAREVHASLGGITKDREARA